MKTKIMEVKMSEKVSYKLQIPQEMYESLKQLADEEGITMAELLHNGSKWAMLINKLKKENARIFVKSDGETRELVAF